MDKIDYLDGQLKALLNFVAVLVKAHPAPERVQELFAAANPSEPDSPEDMSVSDAYLDGFSEVNRRLKELMGAASEPGKRNP